jgi:uncharacterized protein involved in response to NO
MLFELGFRPFYLLAALLAALNVPVLLAQWHGLVAQVAGGGVSWHAHEMVFGFAAAVITGFLFTAGRNWSGLPTPAGARLAALAALWIAGRVAMLTGPSPLTAIIDCAFLPLAALGLWIPLQRSRNRNRFFVGLLLLLALANVLYHLASLGVIALSSALPTRGALYLVLLIVAIMSGRVTPAFTRNAIPTARVRRIPGLDPAAIAMLLAALVLQLAGAHGWLLAVPALLAALLHMLRMVLWDPLSTAHRPILWILHVSYAWIPIGLLLLALSALNEQIPLSVCLHAFGAGAIGGTIIGMITRTARGHSGRPLDTGSTETLAYALVQAGALLRVLGPLVVPEWYGVWLIAGGVAWSTAFLLYLVVYWPILSRPALGSGPA